MGVVALNVGMCSSIQQQHRNRRGDYREGGDLAALAEYIVLCSPFSAIARSIVKDVARMTEVKRCPTLWQHRRKLFHQTSDVTRHTTAKSEFNTKQLVE